MTVSEAKFVSRKIMEAGEIPLLVGHFGVGKTDIAREIASETGRSLIILVLSQMEPGDLIGLPARDGGKTKFLPPDWWPESSEVIILLDEINRAHRSIRNAIMQLLIDRRIHNHVLPSGVWILASMNPPDENYDQVELITDPAFLSRFFVLEVHPDAREWTEWAERNGVPRDVVEFIRKFPELLSVSYPVSLKASIKPSPRSWYKLGKVLSALSESERREYGYVIASGIVGPEAAKVFVDNVTTGLASALEILIDGKIPEKLDFNASNAVLIRIVEYISNLDEERFRQLRLNMDRVVSNLMKIADAVPKDTFAGFMRMLVSLSNTPGPKGEFCDELLKKMIASKGT